MTSRYFSPIQLTISINMRALSRALTFVGIILYLAILAFETREAHEPSLWHDMWKDVWFADFEANDAAVLGIFCVLLFGGLAILWRSLPALRDRHLQLVECGWIAFGLAAVALGALASVESLRDSLNEVGESTSIDDVHEFIAYAVIYSFPFLLLGRLLPLIPILFQKSTAIYNRLCIVGILLFVFAAFAIGIVGTDSSIKMYIDDRYHTTVD